jgi:hypothetical protein
MIVLVLTNTGKSVEVQPAHNADISQVQQVCAGCTQILDPDAAYLSATTKIDITGIPEFTSVTSITDGIQTVTFSSAMQRLQVGSSWSTWSSPPFSEDPAPAILYSQGSTTITMDLSVPSSIVGFELEPNPFDTFTFTAEFQSGGVTICSITRDISGNAGARLLAVELDCIECPAIDRVVITGPVDFSIAQVRYQVCCDTCEPLCTDRDIDFTATFTVDVPFTLAEVGTPAFNGNFNFNGDCFTGTCLQTVMFTVCDTTLECCITLGTVSFSGTADLLISVPATLETDCGSEGVSVIGAVTVPISQTCFSCDVPLVCPDICDLLDVSGLSAVIVPGSQIEVTGTVTFNCPI